MCYHPSVKIVQKLDHIPPFNVFLQTYHVQHLRGHTFVQFNSEMHAYIESHLFP